MRWLLALVVLGGATGGPIRATRTASSRLVIHNYYFAKPGLADSVFRTRVEASAIRQRLGLVVGRVLRRQSVSDSLPDVIWEAEYSDSAARARDVAALDGSAEFDAIQRRMEKFIRRFDRAAWTVAAR
jgi:hypothetical protein